MNKILNEGLDYHDFVGQIKPEITIDEYEAKMGKDSDIVTMAFVVNSKLAAEDLVSWLEIGYDYILDASVSDGEIEPGKYLVFAEMKRKTNTPEKICEILNDLKTLTDLSLNDWTLIIEDESYDADVEVLKQVIYLTPYEYNKNKEGEKELNEYRELANLPSKPLYDNIDSEIKKYINLSK